MARTQRVENLVKNFMLYHNDGYSICEIADVFEVDFSTVYKHLQEIADNNGVTRESLLVIPHSSTSSHLPFYKEKINIEELKNSFIQLEADVDKVIENIDRIL